MSRPAVEYKSYLTTYDSKTKTFGERSITKDQRKELIRDLLRYPGEQGLDERIFACNQWGTYFEENGRYTDFHYGTLEYTLYWEFLKKVSYTGILIDDEFYITGDTIWYWNFIQIPDKAKGKPALPTIWDTDIWWFQLLELSALEGKFTITLKARQRGFSLKACAKILKRLMFEHGFSGKVAAWDEQYNRSNWLTLEDYRKFLNKHTDFVRNYGETGDGKYGLWVEEELRSILKVANTKRNAATVVSGKTDEILFDEAGVAPNLNEMVGFVEPALRQGDLVTGEMHIFGAVGKLDQSDKLKRYFFKPKSGNFLELPNIWSNRPNEMVGIFIPESYSFGSFMDKYGNSYVQKAKEYIEAKSDTILKNKGFEDYKFYRSQHPLTPEDCFAIRKKNRFPTQKIQPHYDKLCREYEPLLVTLKEVKDRVIFDHGSKYNIVTDYPVTPNTEKHGAVVIDEPPISPHPPFGLYYAGTDPIKPISTQMSESLQTVYIYKAAHEIDGELSMDKVVAWYAGRGDDPYKSYEICLNLVKLYNARWAIENDQPAYIEWLFGKDEQHRIMKRSEMPILKDWVPKSRINEEYGWRTGSGNSTVKNKLYDLVAQYCDEEISVTFDPVTGESKPVYGVTRIKDAMLLKEMLDFNNSNADRIIAFGGVLMAAKANTNRGIKVINNNSAEEQALRDQALSRGPSIGSLRTRTSFNSLRSFNSLKRSI